MVSISAPSGKEPNNMSFMVLMKNENGIVITAESRLTIKNLQNTTYKNNFKKLFFNKHHKIIWGITGIYGNNESVISDINCYLSNSIEQAIRLIKLNLVPIENGMTNIFIATVNCYYIIDIDKEVHLTQKYENGIYCAGAHTYMFNYYSPEDIKKDSIHELVKKSVYLTQEEIDIDNIIYQKNSHNDNTMGGDIYSLSIDSKGNIKIYVNEKEFRLN